MKREYLVVFSKPETLQEALDTHSEAGWRLGFMTEDPDNNYTLVFKRRKKE